MLNVVSLMERSKVLSSDVIWCWTLNRKFSAIRWKNRSAAAAAAGRLNTRNLELRG